MLGGEEELTHGRTANSQQFLDSMRYETETGMWLSIARFVRPILWGAAAGCAAEGEGRKEMNFELYVPEGGGSRPPAVRCPSPSSVGPPGRRRSVIPGRREQRQLAAAAAAATASGSKVHLVGEGGGRHHPHPGAAADHAVVHPGRPSGWADATQEVVVETGHSGAAVVAERARGGVVEVADLVVLVVVVRVAHGVEGRVAAGGGRRAVARREEGDGPCGEEVLGGAVSAGARGVASLRAPTAAATQPLHALEVEAVLLEVGWEATFSRMRPSTLISCIMVLGMAFLMPRCATTSTNRLCSCGVHTRRGRLSVWADSSSAPPPPPPLEPAADDAPPPSMSGPPSPGPAPAPPAAPVPPAPCVVMSKATARCSVMSVCVRGISSSGRRSCCSSPRANQLTSSSSLMAAASPRLSLS
jgi:hypothetical protein